MKRIPVFLIACVALGCEQRPPFPDELTFEGSRLEKATDWSSGGISGVVFVPAGETLESASLQFGILVSRDHASGGDLHQWVMEQYRSSPTTQWHESSTSDEACKIGVTPGPRPFAALHVCRSRAGRSACAEADERIGDDVVGRCLRRGFDCWDEVCYRMWATKRDGLEAAVNGVLESQ